MIIRPVIWGLVLLAGCVLNPEPLEQSTLTTGMEGYLPKFTANAQLSQSHIVEDSSSVCIRASAPSQEAAKLCIDTGAVGYQYTLPDMIQAEEIASIQNGKEHHAELDITAINVPSDGSVMLRSNGNPNSGLAFATNQTDGHIVRMTITAGSGNVGIGTTNPQSKLEVAGGYLKIYGGSNSLPTGADCDEASEVGRMITVGAVNGGDETNVGLYVCLQFNDKPHWVRLNLTKL